MTADGAGALLAVDAACWYAAATRRPSISRCPRACNGAPTHAERQGDGVQRFYCDAHAYWRGQEAGRSRLRLLEAGERA